MKGNLASVVVVAGGRGDHTTCDPRLCRWIGGRAMCCHGEDRESGWSGALSQCPACQEGRQCLGGYRNRAVWPKSNAAYIILFQLQAYGVHGRSWAEWIKQPKDVSIDRPGREPGTAMGAEGTAYRVGGSQLGSVFLKQRQALSWG